MLASSESAATGSRGTACRAPTVGVLSLAWKPHLAPEEEIILELLKGDETHLQALAEEGRKLTEAEGESSDPLDEEILILIALCNRATNLGHPIDAEEMIERIYGGENTITLRERAPTFRTRAPTLAKMPLARATI